MRGCMPNFFSEKRIGKIDRSNENKLERSTFEKDHDRIVYSNYFRRLHDKTQVFPYSPLSASNQARSRLSHSLEVSCVARSLGNLTGLHLSEKFPDIRPFDVGIIAASAALAHDIGNPPFGHSGEDAIRIWAKENIDRSQLGSEEYSDMINYEGNAQGFRILSRLEIWQRKGGLRPACATIGAFTKYPCSSSAMDPASGIISKKKFGFFKEDEFLFTEAFEEMGIPLYEAGTIAYPRHPLSFLSEAADDICYAVIDLEDAFHLGVIDYKTLEDLLLPIVRHEHDFSIDQSFDKHIKVSRLRSAAINSMINQCHKCFIENIDSIFSLKHNTPLISEIGSAKQYDIIYDFSMKNIYSSSSILETEYAGFKAIGALLNIFMPAVLSKNPDKQERLGRKLIPSIYYKRYEFSDKYKSDSAEHLIEFLSPYQRMLTVTDYISGMTDRFAIELYRELTGFGKI